MGDCDPADVGLSYTVDGVERVFADDERGFPLRVGDSFVVNHLSVGDVRRR